ncbi:MAG: hypothetical protein JXB38_15100 [Anaerolineales bacterium]|nr:hypothetical protein [Anaerolineales bacterium]
MISKAEFWLVMAHYGAQIMPAQIFFYVIGLVLVAWLFLKPGKFINRVVKVYLMIAFGWNAIVFYFVLASDMAGDTYGNYIIGSVFLIIAGLFGGDVRQQKMQFSLPAGTEYRWATLVLMGLVFCYPLFGLVFGHDLQSLIMPGTFPCPTVALALLLLATALPQIDWIAYFLLLLCAIPATLFMQIARYGVYEDTILLLVGIYGLFVLVKAGLAGNLTAQ